MTRALFLQPHCDATLACGGTAALLVEEGWTVQMVRVFADDAADLRCGTSPAANRRSRADAPITLQRAEDAAAAAVLGCGVRWLGLPSARHRQGGQALPAPGRGPLPREQRELALFIALQVLRLDGWQEDTHVFVPIAAGASVDHRLVFEAGRVLLARGVAVWSYEDLACAMYTPAAVRARVARAGSVLGESVRLPIDTVLARKLDAIGCHVSRLPTLFPFERDYRTAVADHAWRLGGADARACERFWRVVC